MTLEVNLHTAGKLLFAAGLSALATRSLASLWSALFAEKRVESLLETLVLGASEPFVKRRLAGVWATVGVILTTSGLALLLLFP